MKIYDITINHLTEPIGFQFNTLHIAFKIEEDKLTDIQKKLTVLVKNQIIYETEFINYNNNSFDIDLDLNPRTRYDIKIDIHSHNETISGYSYFETGKMNETFKAQWIAHKDKTIQNTLFKKEVTIDKKVTEARLYIAALGVYETYINSEKVGNEFLAPGQTAYDQWIQIQTYDITSYLRNGNNVLTISTADGWYKGPYGFIEGMDCIYGDHQRALAEYHIYYSDGSYDIISSDDSWQTTSGQITKSSIYYGEDRDDTKEVSNWIPVTILNESYEVLSDRLSLPLVVKETLNAKELLFTPKNEYVIDFGQNHAGLMRFYNRTPKGTKIYLQVGEILQEGNFYNGNLRSARAAFEYISDGIEKWVQPKFTYFGYRYMKIEGIEDISLEDFKADVIYSDMEITGEIKTNNQKVNRLFENVIWGQKSNFFDVPTDCPQRDERLGWSGDANVFSNTALFNMNSYPFYRKYLKDLAIEQDLNDGRAPMYAPSFGNKDGGGAIWGDATTVVPWNSYISTGDSSMLIEHYKYMKDWVDWIGNQTHIPNLWTNCFQFGDWLALDGENPAMPTGKTDEDFIASIYYHYSAWIVSETAKLMGNTTEAKLYGELSQSIKKAIQDEYISKNGRLTIDTQTAYALALQFNLIPKEQTQRVVKDLVTRLNKDDDHLKTGFVGTPFINQILSKYGEHKLATKIFLLEDLPSWLYAVNMGATTIWERWNSVEPDGTMNPEGMNSLNHYSIGAIMEWGYKYILGIRNPKDGYKVFDFAPEFDYRLNKIEGYYNSNYGPIHISYQIETDEMHTIKIQMEIPFGTTANVTLPRANQISVQINNQIHNGGEFQLSGGKYNITYIPTTNYIEHYSADTPSFEIMNDEELVKQIDSIDPILEFFKNDPEAIKGGLGKLSLRKLNSVLPFITITDDKLIEIEKLLEKTPILSQRK